MDVMTVTVTVASRLIRLVVGAHGAQE